MIAIWHLDGDILLYLGQHIRTGLCRYQIIPMLIYRVEYDLALTPIALGSEASTSCRLPVIILLLLVFLRQQNNLHAIVRLLDRFQHQSRSILN